MWWSWPGVMTIQHWVSGLFILLSGIPCLKGYSCPDNIQRGTQECLVHYNSMVSTLGLTNANFYTGMDVEDVRHICQSLTTSIRCAQKLKSDCPDTEHTDIEVTLGDLIPTIEMCHSPNFFEVYARNRNCLLRLSASSTRCYNTFQASSDDLISKLYKSGDPTALTKLCSNMDTMITCIITHVKPNCNEEAANLVPLLVKPSIRMSENCKNNTMFATTTKKPEVNEPMVNDDNNLYSASQSAATSCHILTWTLCTVFMILLH